MFWNYITSSQRVKYRDCSFIFFSNNDIEIATFAIRSFIIIS